MISLSKQGFCIHVHVVFTTEADEARARVSQKAVDPIWQH